MWSEVICCSTPLYLQSPIFLGATCEGILNFTTDRLLYKDFSILQSDPLIRLCLLPISESYDRSCLSLPTEHTVIITDIISTHLITIIATNRPHSKKEMASPYKQQVSVYGTPVQSNLQAGPLPSTAEEQIDWLQGFDTAKKTNGQSQSLNERPWLTSRHQMESHRRRGVRRPAQRRP